MRPIKFRAWDKVKKIMTPVAGVWFGDDGSAMTVTFEPAPKTKWYVGLVQGENGILLQFTGLLDKNGREVYEGDIVQNGVKRGEVYQQYGYWTATNIGQSLWSPEAIEVIGNIYENPELLK
ncbi:MAG: YopX family protein [Smithella sp.]|jgi:uncharacterized phage protein (TIGR01671 family)